MRRLSELFQRIKGVVTLLDCGCGRGIWGYMVRAEYGERVRTIGLDVYLPYLKFCKSFKVYDHLILACASKLPFRDKSVSFILASELIEHLVETDAMAFLEDIDRICKGRIVLTTPNGPRRMWESSNMTVKSEIHRSGWEVNDLKSLKYRICGLGFKWIKISELYPIGAAVHFISTPLTYLIPRLAEFLVAVRDFKELVSYRTDGG